MSQGKATNPIVIEQIRRNIQKGNSLLYICCSLGVSKSLVYSQLNADPKQYEKYRAQRKAAKAPKRKPAPPVQGYKEKLPPEQWRGAEVFLSIVKSLKRGWQKDRSGEIDIDTIKSIWQARMEKIA